MLAEIVKGQAGWCVLPAESEEKEKLPPNTCRAVKNLGVEGRGASPRTTSPNNKKNQKGGGGRTKKLVKCHEKTSGEESALRKEKRKGGFGRVLRKGSNKLNVLHDQSQLYWGQSSQKVNPGEGQGKGLAHYLKRGS